MPKKITETEKYLVNMTKNAEDDLSEIVLSIAQYNPQTALKILEKIQTKINTLDHSPNKGAYVPELLYKNIRDYRQITELPWKIIYKVNDDIVYILAIMDLKRNLSDVLLKKLLN